MRKKQYEGFCTHPDWQCPELICGYPLPCPYHTVIIETESDPPMIKIPATIPQAFEPKLLDKLKKIANVLKE